MKVAFEYSHLGGAEILQVRYPEINAAIYEAIEAIGDDFQTLASKEKSKQKNLLYSPKGINAAFKKEFEERGFKELRRTFDTNVPGWKNLGKGFKQIDFARDRVLVEVQLGKYFAMFYDMAKLDYFYRENVADVGVEIVPSYLLQAQMSSGVGRGEMLLVDMIALQRSFPTFPVKIILIQPDDVQETPVADDVIAFGEDDDESDS